MNEPPKQLIDPAAMDGMSVVECFRNFVLGAPTVRAAGAAAEPVHSLFGELASTGMMGEGARYWLLIDSPQDLLSRQVASSGAYNWRNAAVFVDDPRWNLEPEYKEPEARALVDALYHAFQQILAPLRDGTVEAVEPASGKLVPASLWNAPGYWLDVKTGDVGRTEQDSPITEFRSLMLRRPVAAIHHSEPASAENATMPDRKKSGPMSTVDQYLEQSILVMRDLIVAANSGKLPVRKLPEHVQGLFEKHGIKISRSSAQRYLSKQQNISVETLLEIIKGNRPG